MKNKEILAELEDQERSNESLKITISDLQQEILEIEEKLNQECEFKHQFLRLYNLERRGGGRDTGADLLIIASPPQKGTLAAQSLTANPNSKVVYYQREQLQAMEKDLEQLHQDMLNDLNQKSSPGIKDGAQTPHAHLEDGFQSPQMLSHSRKKSSVANSLRQSSTLLPQFVKPKLQICIDELEEDEKNFESDQRVVVVNSELEKTRNELSDLKELKRTLQATLVKKEQVMKVQESRIVELSEISNEVGISNQHFKQKIAY